MFVFIGRECRERAAAVNNSEINAFINENVRTGDAVVYTDGSVSKGKNKSGWAFSARVNGTIVKESSGAFEITSSSMMMEVTTITVVLKWICDHGFRHVLVATDSQSTLEKVNGGRLYTDWVPLVQGSRLKKITWLFCPGHAGINGNERADQLAGDADINGSLTLDHCQVIKLVKESLLSGDNEDEASLTLSTLKEKGVQRGVGQRSELWGQTRRVANQLTMGTISLATLRWTLQRRGEQIWTCSDCEEAGSSPR